MRDDNVVAFGAFRDTPRIGLAIEAARLRARRPLPEFNQEAFDVARGEFDRVYRAYRPVDQQEHDEATTEGLLAFLHAYLDQAGR